MDEEVTPATIATATIAAAATAEERQPATDDDVVPDFEASVTEPEVPDLGFDEIRKQADDLIGGAELEDDGEESSDDVVRSRYRRCCRRRHRSVLWVRRWFRPQGATELPLSPPLRSRRLSF